VDAVGGRVNPKSIGKASDEALRGTGLSRGKLAAVRDLAEKSRRLGLNELEHLPDDEVRVGFEQAEDVVAEFLDQACHLVVGQTESGQPGDRSVDLPGLPPLVTQPFDRRQRKSRRFGYGFRLFNEHPVEIPAEAFGDESRLDRPDAFDLWMIGQVVGESVRIQLEVVFHGFDIELASVLGVCDPAAAEDDLLVLTHEQPARELDLFAGGRYHPARGKTRTGIEHRFDATADSYWSLGCFSSHRLDTFR
jgi:hypothetical protein